MDFSKKTPQKTGFQRQSMGLFGDRQKKVEGFAWARVDAIGMIGAFAVAGQNGATLSIAPGNGGAGVTVRIYMGEKGDYAYAADIEQLNEIFELLIAKMGSKSEDVRMALEGVTIRSIEAMPAD